jgi:hypothetical protein
MNFKVHNNLVLAPSNRGSTWILEHWHHSYYHRRRFQVSTTTRAAKKMRPTTRLLASMCSSLHSRHASKKLKESNHEVCFSKREKTNNHSISHARPHPCWACIRWYQYYSKGTTCHRSRGSSHARMRRHGLTWSATGNDGQASLSLAIRAEEIAYHTTCWCFFCKEPQQWLFVARNTTFYFNSLHRTHKSN